MTKQLSPEQSAELLSALKTRFEQNMNRHKGVEWAKVQAKLEANPAKLWSLDEMEITGGEPDVVGYDDKTSEYIFYDCSAESPKERRSLCYDRAAHNARKEHKPANSAMDVAEEMGIELLTEEEYCQLQQLGKFDLKTSSWVKHRIISANWAGLYFVTDDMILYLPIITARNPIMLREAFVGY